MNYGENVLNICFIFLIFSLLFMQGCEGEFQPLQENDKYYFSMYGYLDATADTQKVRISPARDTFETPAQLPEMSVTIENHYTGDTTPMYGIVQNIPGDISVVNVWAVADIQPNGMYTLEAERPDGRRSSVTVHIPDDFPTPVFIEDRSITRPRMNRVIVQGVDNIAGFHTRWYVRLSGEGYEEFRTFTFYYRNEAEYTTGYNGAFVIPFSQELELQKIEQQMASNSVEVLHKQVFVATAGSDWIEDINDVGDLEYALPEGLTNVKDGLGYVIGIVSKIIPYGPCRDEMGNAVGCPEEKPFW